MDFENATFHCKETTAKDLIGLKMEELKESSDMFVSKMMLLGLFFTYIGLGIVFEPVGYVIFFVKKIFSLV